jgi:hypothetical protein
LSAPDTILFDVGRLNRLYGGLSEIAETIALHAGSMGLTANIAIAPNAETALIAARNFPGITLIPEEAADALAALDIENLPLTPELWQTLESWASILSATWPACPVLAWRNGWGRMGSICTGWHAERSTGRCGCSSSKSTTKSGWSWSTRSLNWSR